MPQQVVHRRFTLTQSFSALGLSAELTRVVAEQGYTEPTPYRRRPFRSSLEGRDVLAGAQTGTGKTAGFTLPLLQRLSHHACPCGLRRSHASACGR
jgi:ATP-dependent RNA helicase RhlE